MHVERAGQAADERAAAPRTSFDGQVELLAPQIAVAFDVQERQDEANRIAGFEGAGVDCVFSQVVSLGQHLSGEKRSIADDPLPEPNRKAISSRRNPSMRCRNVGPLPASRSLRSKRSALACCSQERARRQRLGCGRPRHPPVVPIAMPFIARRRRCGQTVSHLHVAISACVSLDGSTSYSSSRASKAPCRCRARRPCRPPPPARG